MSKNYIGDLKWVLYQHVCDLSCEEIYFRCGKYAFEKMKSMLGARQPIKSSTWIQNDLLYEEFSMSLNGETNQVAKNYNLDKKQIIITPVYHKVDKDKKYDGYEFWIDPGSNDSKAYPNDIVLYFA